jgi:hypothetical protein
MLIVLISLVNDHTFNTFFAAGASAAGASAAGASAAGSSAAGASAEGASAAGAYAAGSSAAGAAGAGAPPQATTKIPITTNKVNNKIFDLLTKSSLR